MKFLKERSVKVYGKDIIEMNNDIDRILSMSDSDKKIKSEELIMVSKENDWVEAIFIYSIWECE